MKKQFKKYIILLCCSFLLMGCKKKDFYYSIENNSKVIDASNHMVNSTTSLEHIFLDAPLDKATSVEFFDINLNEMSLTNLKDEEFKFSDISSNGKPSLFIYYSPYCSACDHVEYAKTLELLGKDYNILFITEYNTSEEREYLEDKGVDLKYGYTVKLNEDTKKLKDLPFPSMLFISSEGNIKIMLEGYVNPEGAKIYMSFME